LKVRWPVSIHPLLPARHRNDCSQDQRPPVCTKKSGDRIDHDCRARRSALDVGVHIIGFIHAIICQKRIHITVKQSRFATGDAATEAHEIHSWTTAGRAAAATIRVGAGGGSDQCLEGHPIRVFREAPSDARVCIDRRDSRHRPGGGMNNLPVPYVVVMAFADACNRSVRHSVLCQAGP